MGVKGPAGSRPPRPLDDDHQRAVGHVEGKLKRMRGRCPRCGGEQELLSRPRRVLLHALPELRSPAEIVDPLACANCGCEVQTTVRYVSTDRPVEPPGTPENRPAAEMCTGLVGRFLSEIGAVLVGFHG